MSTEKKNGFCFAYEVKETADKGLGVFAAEKIEQGSIVWRHVSGQYTVYDEHTFKIAIEKMSHGEVVYELTHVFGLEELPGCLIRVHDDGVLMNHSNNANLATNNAGAVEKTFDVTSPQYLRDVTRALLDVRYALVATRNIETGEEFTNDYVAEEGVADPPFYDVLYEQYGVSEDYLEDC
jgi:hypothetical protein